MAKQFRQFQTIRTEGAILPPDVLRRIASLKVDGATSDAYHLPPGSKLNEAISQSWTSLLNYWLSFREACETLPESEQTATAITNERWLLPLFKELDYGRLPTTKSPEIDERVYPIERFYNHTPIHLIGCKLPLDRRTKGARGAATANPHSMVQEFLNRSNGHLWAFLSNGLQLRILRDNVSLSRQAFVEFDLEAMMEGEVYPDFALLWLLCHQSRVETDKPEECWLEKWSQLAREEGTRVLKDLRVGVAKAIEALGRGFIGHPRNDRLREKLHRGTLSKDEYYRQLLRIVYRMLFLFVAEDRELLHPPNSAEEACNLYDTHYSTRRLRDLALKMRGSKHADLWHSLSLGFNALGKKEGSPHLALCGLGSFLWRASSTVDLLGPHQVGDGDTEPVLITNDDLLQAIRELAYVEQDRMLRMVDYRNLGSEELGSVYEALLELHPVMNVDAKSFELLTAAGNERKITGSYYTPDSLVQCLLDSALDPVVADRLKGKKGEDAEQAILDLKICDPACGSGHFLIAAAARLARHLARLRTGETEPSPEDYQHALRDVIGRCLYGVDINPMAVELCKVSLWMEAIEPGKPLSFLDHHIQCGNSLLGSTPALLARGILDDAFKPIEGDDKAVCSELKAENKRQRQEYESGQGYLFATLFNLGILPEAISQINVAADESFEDVVGKQEMYERMVKGANYLSARLLADTWCAAFVWKKDKSDLGKHCPTERYLRNIENNPHSILPQVRAEVRRLADQYKFFHWHLAFPDVFRLPQQGEQGENEQTGWNTGFDVVIGNPPYLRIQRVAAEEAKFLYAKYASATSKVDLSLLFMEQCVQLINPLGLSGLVCPSQWLFTDYGKNLRAYLGLGYLSRMVDFGSLPVFTDADTYAAIYTLCRTRGDSLEIVKVRRIEDAVPGIIRELPSITVPTSDLDGSPWNVDSVDIVKELSKSETTWIALEVFADVCIGALTGQDNSFVVDRATAEAECLEEEILIPYAYRGAEVRPFVITHPSARIIFPYQEGQNGTPVLLNEKHLQQRFPNAHQHLKSYEDSLRRRKDSRKFYADGEHWYRFLRAGNYRYIIPRKVLIKGIETHCVASLLNEGTAFNGANCPGLVLKSGFEDENWLFFFLGLLNSDVASAYLRAVCPRKLGGYFRFNATNISNTPVPATLATQGGLTSAGLEVAKLAQSYLSLDFPDRSQLNEVVFECYRLSNGKRQQIAEALSAQETNVEPDVAST